MKILGNSLMLLWILLTAGCLRVGAATTAPPGPAGDIVIASDLPTSDQFGKPIVRAIRLAISEHPRVGRFRLDYWSLDDSVAGKWSSEKGVQNVHQMIDDARVLGMVGPENSAVAFPEIPVANQADLVMISPANTSICLTQPAAGCRPDLLHPTGRANYFRIAPPEEAQTTAMARYAVQYLNVRKVAVINEYGATEGSTITGLLERELARAGGEIVLREDVTGDTSDFKSFLAEAHARGAQAIYAFGDTDATHSICLARAQMEDAALFLGTDGIATIQKCIDQAASRSESMYATFPDVDITQNHDPESMKVVRAFRKAYPGISPNTYTFAAYDATQILIAAIEGAIRSNNGALPTRRQVMDSVASIHFVGVTGTYSFDKNGDATSPLMSMYQVVKGKWVYLSKIDASPTPS